MDRNATPEEELIAYKKFFKFLNEEIKRCVLNYYKLQAKKEKDMNIKVEKNNKEFKNVNDVNFGDTFWARTIEDEDRNDCDFLAMKVEIDCDLVGG